MHTASKQWASSMSWAKTCAFGSHQQSRAGRKRTGWWEVQDPCQTWSNLANRAVVEGNLQEDADFDNLVTQTEPHRARKGSYPKNCSTLYYNWRDRRLKLHLRQDDTRLQYQWKVLDLWNRFTTYGKMDCCYRWSFSGFGLFHYPNGNSFYARCILGV